MATHSSVLAWRIPWTAEPGGLSSMGSHRVRHNWSDLAAAAAYYNIKRIMTKLKKKKSNVFSSEHLVCCCPVTQLCPPLCDPTDCSMVGLPVPYHLPEFEEFHVHYIGDAIQPSHPLTSSSPSVLDLSQQQGLFQWVICLHPVKNTETSTSALVLSVIFRVDLP